jgi:alkylhydroperoxidase family enzyme
MKTRDEVIAVEPDAFFRLDRDGQGALLDIHRVLMNAPRLFKLLMELSMELRHGCALDPKLRELAILTVARTIGSEYELDHHWPLAIRVGVSDAQLDGLADYLTSPAFTVCERAVMRFAESSTRDVHVPQAVFNEVKVAIGEPQVVELGYQIGFYNFIARMIGIADLKSEEWFDRLHGITNGSIVR